MKRNNTPPSSQSPKATLKKPKLKAIIMAGGQGKRLWPRSNANTPKQFLPLTSEKSLIVETYNRLCKHTSLKTDDIFFAIGNSHVPRLIAEFPRLKLNLSEIKNTIVEPQAKDTAAAICLAAMHLNHYRKSNLEDVLFFLPADATIGNVPAFHKAVSKAYTLAAKGNCMVLLGIKPTRASTEFGYLETTTAKNKETEILHVKNFIEKPSLAKAKRYIKKSNFFWNSGMFFMTSGFLLAAFEKHAPQYLQLLQKYIRLNASKKQKAALAVFAKLNKISFDYAIAEQLSGNIHAIPADIEWDDLGGYEALKRRQPTDENGNCTAPRTMCINKKNSSSKKKTSTGKAIFYKSENNYVDSSKTVVLSGVKNLTVIVDGDTIFINGQQTQQDTKALLDYLQSLGKDAASLL